MHYKVLGRRSGLRVSELALGAGNFGTGWGHGAERDEAKRIFDGYLEAGGNFIDTANGYQAGQSEVMVGEFIAAERHSLVVATKYTMGTTPSAGISHTGNNRKNMVRAVEESLKRLNTEHIDLFWAHISDGLTPMEEILRGFDDLVRSGKILYAGLSNFPAWRIARADLLAEIRGYAPIVAIQAEYSLAERSAERDLLPMAEALGLGATLWSPLGGGLLTGKYRESSENTRASKLGRLIHVEKNARDSALIDTLLAVAKELGATPTHVAIAWLREQAKRSVTSLIPILGPRTREQLDGTLGALQVRLSPEHLARLDEVSSVVPGVPHAIIAEATGRYRGSEPFDLPLIPVI
ncbi:aldo/keto reductase [Pseudomonas gingeri]|uniref:Aldo/keto reductase n=1 Tax=Pseudomonas gingeri TaxID=117681 RepID=A0A7Y7Y8T0_9PSED|nr:aldo/keto reductase [Pseudomonas gingeri]NWB29816.1 aldo/keto reductase [Pseudomonas gingeri]NWC31952.1 aldo/keto reductase [Pseudomonas gingeri]NWD08866.1 aldo/keto reductase [Pseudomonas gingeri]NWD48568.1 aldo/keto reductase [Pseudomonas gingeri]NWE29665.1 aldo/keto reductase [Pseudomonas gingeri]